MQHAGMFEAAKPILTISKIEDEDDLVWLFEKLQDLSIDFPYLADDARKNMVLTPEKTSITYTNGASTYWFAVAGDFIVSNQTPEYVVIEAEGRDRLAARDIPREFADRTALRSIF